MKSNIKWFIKKRGSYLPKSWQAVLLYAIYLAYIIWIFVYVFRQDYAIWPAVFILVPNWIAACAIITWVASKKS